MPALTYTDENKIFNFTSQMQVTRALDSLLNRFALFVVPVFIVCATLAILLSQNGVNAAAAPDTLSFKVLPDPLDTIRPEQVPDLVAGATLHRDFDTKRAEHPYWLWIPLSASGLTDSDVEFSSRHTHSLECRDAQTLTSVGDADRNTTSGNFRKAKAGFALRISKDMTPPAALICRATFAGPARIKIAFWSAEDLFASEQGFYVSAGWLQGGLLTLVFFTVVISVINREARYFVLAMWLLCNLRIASLSLGWDVQWLGYKIPTHWMLSLRQITIAAYYVITSLLFYQYFLKELLQLGYHRALQILMAGGVALLIFALVLPFASFLPVMWLIASSGISIGMFLLAEILRHHPTRTAVYFSLAMGFHLLAILAEVLAAAFSWNFAMTVFNSVSAAWASSVLVIVALSEHLRREKEERISAEEQLNRTYDSAPIGLFTMDHEGRFLRTNPRMAQILNSSADANSLGNISGWFDDLDLALLREIASREGGGEVELHRSFDGPRQSKRWFLVKVVEAGDKIEGALQDITERNEATEQLRYLANHDSLTGLLNRRGITFVLDRGVQSAAQGKPYSLLFVDLNRFKLVNELYRTQVGDQILKQVAERIQHELPADSKLGRWGDDQYLAVMPGHSVAETRAMAERIVIAVNTLPYKFGQQVLQVAVAMGLVDITGTMTTVSAISTAQRACEKAKQGSIPLVIYDVDAGVHQERLEELHLIKLLGADTLPDGLHLVMQPILSLRAPEESLNFEILLRFKDVGGRMVPVNLVLDAAVASGNMARLDKWVLTETLRWLLKNHQQLPNTQFVAVNLSGTALNDRAFLDDVIEILKKYQSVVHYLCLEINEGVALNDLVNANMFIEKLRECGASIALDDFGAGYTSFSYLRNLRADALKIDGAFVRSINNHPANVAIVAAIVDLAHNLGMRSVAEGVEEPAMLEVLAEIGVDYVQGYVVTRPQPLDTALSANSAASYISEPEVISTTRKLAEMRKLVEKEMSEDNPLYH